MAQVARQTTPRHALTLSTVALRAGRMLTEALLAGGAVALTAKQTTDATWEASAIAGGLAAIATLRARWARPLLGRYRDDRRDDGS